jgi:hypothetical protein
MVTARFFWRSFFTPYGAGYGRDILKKEGFGRGISWSGEKPFMLVSEISKTIAESMRYTRFPLIQMP